jgi:O-antigen/teichoic acid export membrane protein
MKDRIAMAVSIVTRMGAGLLVFILMARGLGPETYGLVVTVIAYATLASLITDFGFSSKTLRDIAADRKQGGEILNTSLNVKILLTALVLFAGTVLVLLIPVDLETRAAMILLSAAILVAAVGDLSLTAYRAMGRFVSESWLTLWTSLVHLVLIGWISLMHGGLLLLAVAFFVSRCVYTGLALRGAFGLFSYMHFQRQSLGKVLHTGRSALSWAADSGLNYLNGQLDALLVAPLFGLQAAGIYQGGARFAQAALGMVGILANIHIPRIAAQERTAAPRYRATLGILAEFAAVGATFALFFWGGGPWLTLILLGPDFAAVDDLWLGFAAFVFFRYIAAAAGAQLAAYNMPRTRVGGQLIGLAILILGFAVFVPHTDYTLVPWLMTTSAIAICILYWGALFWRLHTSRNS